MSDKPKWEFDGYCYTMSHGIVTSVVDSDFTWFLKIDAGNNVFKTRWEPCSNISNAKRAALREGKRANEALSKL